MAESSGSIFGPVDAETGDLSQFDSTTQEGSCTITSQGTTVAHGSYSFLATADGTYDECYGVMATGSESEFYCRMYIYLDSSIGGSSFASEWVMVLGDGGVFTYGVRAGFQLNNSGVPYRWRIYSVNGDIDITSTTNFSLDAWHCIEVHWVQSATVGGAQVWVDGTSIVSSFTHDTSSRTVDNCYFGMATGTVLSASSLIYFDDIKADTSYIGLYADAGGISIPAVIWHLRQQGVC